MFGLADNLIKQFEEAPLLRSHQLGIADDIDEEHIGDLKLNFLLNLHGHGGQFYSVTSEGSTSFFRRQMSDYFGASELTIFSKRGSPRSGSYHGSSFSRPYVTKPGSCAALDRFSKARSFSPTHAATIPE